MRKVKLLFILFISSFTTFSQIPTNGLVGRWTFSGNPNDESGNNSNGVVHGASLAVDRNGNPDAAYYFDGIDDYISIENPYSDFSQNELAISFWVNFEALKIGAGMGLSSTTTINWKWLFHAYQVYTNGKPANSFSFWADYANVNTGTLIPNTWYHIVMWFDGTTIKIYLDGNLSISETQPDQLPTFTNTKMHIGKDVRYASGRFFKGKFDDIAIYNRVLTDAEIQLLYQDPGSPSGGTGGSSLWTANGNSIYYNNGNVGIGQDVPTTDLDIKGSIRVGSDDEHVLQISDDVPNNVIQLSTSQRTQSSTPRSILFRSFGSNSNTNIMFLNGVSGNVGIGTMTPSAHLDVMGNIRVGTDNEHVFQITDDPLDNTIQLSTSQRTQNSIPRNILFRSFGSSSNGNIMFMNGVNGNVGIGTTTTGSHKLAVEGSIGAREVKVEASGWSDFVFEKDYELRTLDEVEKYISENRHLPDVPSEAEVTENGIYLGEMDAKLLQKIEELTLYLIEQNKLNKAQQTRIEQLEKKIAQLEKEE